MVYSISSWRSSLFLLVSISLTGTTTTAQLTPNPVYNPPTASTGLTSSNGSSPNTQWSNLLGNSLWFYEAQRTGELPSSNRVAWRNTSVTSDGSDVGLDLSRGYFDAGDYILSTFPLSFSLFSIAWGALSHGTGYDSANQTAYLDEMLRWGFDWSMRAHPQPNVLYVQVGNSMLDNEYWGGDQNIPTPRPSYAINSTNPGTDAASCMAAAFAISSLLYTPSVLLNTSNQQASPSAIQNSTYASQLLTHAEDLYGFAMNSTIVRYAESVPEAGEAYNSSTIGDNLALAALSLALTTNSSAYYSDAYAHYKSYSLSNSQAVLNWDSKIPAVYLLFNQIAVARPNLAVGAGLSVNQTGWQKEMETYLDRAIAGSGNGYYTKGGLLYYDGDSDGASLNPALNAAMVAARYAPLASTSDKTTSYNDFALKQLNYAMGENPMKAVYVVGQHPNSPQNPHSAMSSGGDDIKHINSVPSTEAHVFYGALVGGPDMNDKFYDLRDDYPETEIALDYNAPLLSLAAWQVQNSNIDPYYTTLQAGTYTAPSGQPCDDAYPCSSGGGGLSTGGKIAIGVIVPVVVLALAGLAFWFWRKRSKRRW